MSRQRFTCLRSILPERAKNKQDKQAVLLRTLVMHGDNFKELLIEVTHPTILFFKPDT